MQNKSQFVYDQNSLESDYSYSPKYFSIYTKNLLIFAWSKLIGINSWSFKTVVFFSL